MVPTDRVLAFAAMSLLVLVVPGPSVLFVIGRAHAHGRRTAVATAVGIGSLVRLAGAAYLVLLGVQAFRHRRELKVAAITSRSSGPARGDLRTVLDGVLVGASNPKGIVFFRAVITDTLWGLTASAARAWFARSDRRLSLIGGAGGFTMTGLGLTVAVTGRAD